MKKIYLEQIGLKHKDEIYKIKEEYDKNSEDYNGAFFIYSLMILLAQILN